VSRPAVAPLIIAGRRFSVTDARQALALAPSLLDQQAEGRAAGVLEPHRRQVTEALAGLDPASAPPDALVGPLTRVWAALVDAGPALRAAGALPATVTGTVAQLNRSAGGVPKEPVDEVSVDLDGIVGDVQANRTLHGRPWQALCLWSVEVIDAFRADGNPLRPGAAGENATVAGLPWAEVRPGVRLRLGSVLCAVWSYTLPCAKNARWFRDRAFDLMHHDRGPVSRVYATVLEPGTIAAGDPAVLEP
jgi:MOSC domain-containing protein YiiM